MRSEALLMVLALGGTACQGVGPGEVRVFRVGISAVEISPECYFPDEEVPEDVASDNNTFFAPSTMVMYYGFGDRMLLDAQGVSYEGKTGGDGFIFTAYDVDVDYVGIDNNEAQVTVTTEAVVNMEVSGDAVGGDFTATEIYRCEFLTATPSGGLCQDTPNCVRRALFSGVEIDDADVVSDVDDPNPF